MSAMCPALPSEAPAASVAMPNCACGSVVPGTLLQTALQSRTMAATSHPYPVPSALLPTVCMPQLFSP